MINRLALRCALLLALAGVGLLARAASGQESAAVPVLADRTHTAATAGARAVNPGSPAPTSRAPLHVRTVAQACWLEATWRHDDCAAITRALERRAVRARLHIAQMAWRYSLNKPTTRAAYAQRLPAGLSAREIERWDALVGVVEEALARTIPDPCPHATHWGSPSAQLPDVDRAERALREGRWRLVKCRTKTANAFYAENGPRARAKALAAGVASGGGR